MIKLLTPEMPSADEIYPYLLKIDTNQWYTNFGPLNQRLEHSLSDLFGAHVVTASSATLALELVLTEHVGKIAHMPAFTFPATAMAALKAGMSISFCDIDPITWMMTPTEVGLTDTDDVFVPVCPLGSTTGSALWPQDGSRNVVFDAAAAFGNGGKFGVATAVYSMHATKTMGSGEGGFIVTRDGDLAYRLRMRQNFGLVKPGSEPLLPFSTNAKLSEYHAAVGLASMDRWLEVSERRREIAGWYLERLRKLPVILQGRSDNDVRCTMECLLPSNVSINSVISKLHSFGIETRRWYYPALYKCAAFSYHQPHKLPVTDDISNRLLGLPFSANFDKATVDHICNHFEMALEEKSC